ncbi:MAG: hypothetical protein M5U26_01700 [Planctomycetota bacterium]|nr:hypothetical protein [Planctomycetota bacterium]
MPATSPNPDEPSADETPKGLTDGRITWALIVILLLVCALTWYFATKVALPSAPGAPIG